MLIKADVSFYARNWLRKNDLEPDFMDMFYGDNKDLEKAVMLSDDNRDIAKMLLMMANRSNDKIDTLVKTMVDEEDMGSGGDSYGDQGGDYGGGTDGEDPGTAEEDNFDAEDGDGSRLYGGKVERLQL